VTDHDQAEQVALHRFGVISEMANDRLSPAERGLLARQICARSHVHPDGAERRYSRGTIDRWLRQYRRGGLDALKPPPRSDTGAVRAHPELYAEAAALRLELPSRSAAQIASILYHRHGIRVAERTVREQLRRAGLHRAALEAEPKAFGRYEAERPNERWITDVLVGPFVPFPKLDRSVRARLFLIVDDHSRLLVDGRFFAHENARSCQELLRRAIVRRGVPSVLYADNGSPFKNAWLTRTCGVLGIRLVHSKPYSPLLTGQLSVSSSSWPVDSVDCVDKKALYSTGFPSCNPPGRSALLVFHDKRSAGKPGWRAMADRRRWQPRGGRAVQRVPRLSG
jgi:putative transposase